MKLWVVGADGLLGSALKKHADLATGKKEVDISDLEALRLFAQNHPGITHIINAAAFSLVDLAETNRELAFKANVLGPENLGRLAAEIRAQMVHVSTDYVFSGDVHRPLKEEDPTEPCNYYGWTKLEGEKRLLRTHPTACIVRTSWIFGFGGKNFVSKLLQLFLETDEEIQLTNDHWNRPTSASDLTSALLNLRNASGIFHFANEGIATKYEFGSAMREEAEALGFPITAKRIAAVPGSTFLSPAKRPVYSGFDTSKVEKYLGQPIRHWREALREYLKGFYEASF